VESHWATLPQRRGSGNLGRITFLPQLVDYRGEMYLFCDRANRPVDFGTRATQFAALVARADNRTNRASIAVGTGAFNRRQAMLFFAIGLLVACVAQWAFTCWAPAKNVLSNTDPSSLDTRPRSRSASAHPWGDLEIIPLVLERPNETLHADTTPTPEIRWVFQNFSAASLGELIQSCGLTATEQATLLETNRWQATTNGWNLFPPLELVRELSESSRAKLYSALARSPQNPQHYPFVCREDGFDELLEGCELSSERVQMVRQLCYRRNGLLYFSDGHLFELLTSSNETRCLFRTLLRVPTMLVKLQVHADSEVDQLAEYWGVGGRANDLKPLLQSLARRPGGASINISHFLPPLPRLRLYTYPPATNGPRQDCFWTSFTFFGERPGYKLGDRRYASSLLDIDYVRWYGEKRLGDVLILVESDVAVHACVYIADDIYYTKNGTDPNQPWVLMRMKDLKVQYASDQPQEWRVFRKKSTSR
jgi:hypothetical protein